MTATKHTFSCEVEKPGNRQTRVVCHGSLVNQTSGQLKETVRPLIDEGGQIIVDLGDVAFVDSMGLGTLVALKASAVMKGFCTLEFEHLTPRVQELLRMTKLTELLGVKG